MKNALQRLSDEHIPQLGQTYFMSILFIFCLVLKVYNSNLTVDNDYAEIKKVMLCIPISQRGSKHIQS